MRKIKDDLVILNLAAAGALALVEIVPAVVGHVALLVLQDAKLKRKKVLSKGAKCYNTGSGILVKISCGDGFCSS